ncbi:hypothetical protein F0L68_27165 [Solihabitans fulvus]|uniref:ABC-2 family transporter protein n=1 Tax=Solihabitans fulvus TaxID=1892852 RepID=A0A5B2WYY9_9PSEU|nr:hypothetical protein [Solihabitans fulvus]KAA2256124.1 hypothetical protein F0L68_27165 [Solihabitans fulvus]
MTWRQHRWLIVGTTVAVAVTTGQFLRGISGLRALAARMAGRVCAGACSSGDSWSEDRSVLLNTVGQLHLFVQVFPVLVALTWGGSLVSREYEGRTHVLAWSQDVSPTRWLLAKVGYLGGVLVVLGIVLVAADDAAYRQALAVSTSGDDINRFPREIFDALSAPVFFGQLVFGFALGVAVGALVRQVGLTIPCTLFSYLAVMLLCQVAEQQLPLFRSIECEILVGVAALLIFLAERRVRVRRM